MADDTLDRVEKLLNQHLGRQFGANTPNIPHPQLCAVKRGNYVETNAVTRRVFDPTTVSLQQLAEVLGTLIADLQSLRVVG